MGPNDQYPYNYDANSTTHTCSEYQQQTVPVTATPAYRHTRTASGPNSMYPNLQQAQNQAQTQAQTQTRQPSAPQQYAAGTTGDGSQGAAEALNRISRYGPSISSPTLAPQYSPSGLPTDGVRTQPSGPYLHANTIRTNNAPYYSSTVYQNQVQHGYDTSINYGATQRHTQYNSHAQQQRPSSVNSVRSIGAAPQQLATSQTPGVRTGLTHEQQYHPQQRIGQMTNSENALRSVSPARTQAGQHLQSLQQAHQPASSSALPNATYDSAHNLDQSTEAGTSHYYSSEEAQATNGTQQQTRSFYGQPSTVDPTVLYDPWPEHQRNLELSKKAKEAQRAKEAAEKAAREAEYVGIAATDAAKEDEGTTEAVPTANKDHQEKGRDANSEGRNKNRQSANGIEKAAFSITPATSIEHNCGPAPSSGLDISQILNGAAESENPEAQIKALMAMVKVMNDKHPSLLAKIWEQERQEHLQKTASQSPVVTRSPVVTSPPISSRPAANATTSTTTSHGLATKPSTKGPSANVEHGLSDKTSQDQLPSKTPTAAKTQQPAQRQQQPARNSAHGATIWPKDKKGQLAASAAAWLNAIPENRNNSIQPSKIEEILDGSPTYIELCEILEATGLKLERAAFARALLSVVPEATKTSSSTVTPAASKPPTKFPYTAGERTIELPSQPPARSNLEARPRSANAPPQDTQYRSPYFDANAQPIPLSDKTTPAPSVGEGKFKGAEIAKAMAILLEPASKKDAARKRNFADIVDLTALSDDDPPLPPSKLQRYEYSAPPHITVPGQAYQIPPSYPQVAQGMAPPYLYPQQQEHSAFRQQPPARAIDERLKGVELAKVIERKKALRRSSYDVKTIARDVLLATGKHPDMLPLNGHLEPLRLAFPRQIDFTTDLETVRWDLIDPGEPVPPTSRSSPNAGDDDRDSVLNDADDESDRETHRARMQQLASHSILGSHGSASLVQVGQPGSLGLGKGGVPGGNLNRRPGRPKRIRMSDPGGFQSRPLGFDEAPRSSSGQHQQPNERPLDTPSNTNRSISTTNVFQFTPSNRATDTPPNSAPTAPGYSAFVRTDEQGNPIKKKGRPVGWRKSLHQKGVGVYAGGSGTSAGVPSKSSGLQKAVSSTPKPPDVKYAVYLCKWKDCKAQLHNLETLTKHLNKLHGKVDEKGRFTCKWADCAKSMQTVDQSTGAVKTVQQYHYFPDFALWAKHVKEAHVNPVAWRLGDGPPGGVSGQLEFRVVNLHCC
jgi:hypothetical protein